MPHIGLLSGASVAEEIMGEITGEAEEARLVGVDIFDEEVAVVEVAREVLIDFDGSFDGRTGAIRDFDVGKTALMVDLGFDKTGLHFPKRV
jgi:hypothetical protein